MVKGVNHLHNWKPPVIHRDLKTLNLLVDEFYNVVVSDFGISRFVVDENLSTLTKLRGTYSYCAPELYMGKQASAKSDIYSIGVILWELITRTIAADYVRPYSEYKGFVMEFSIIIQVAKNNVRPTILKNTPEPLTALIKRCWDGNADNRCTCEQILEDLYSMKATCEKEKDDPNSMWRLTTPIPIANTNDSHK